MKKIIIILTFSPRIDHVLQRFSSLPEFTEYYRKNIGDLDFLDIDEPAGRIFFIKGEFQHILSVETLTRTNEFEIEFWRPYHGINNSYSKNVDGVLHKVFPGYRRKSFGFSPYINSPALNDALREEIRKGDVLLSLPWPTRTITELLLAIRPLTVPVLVNHRSGTLFHFHYRNAKRLERLNPVYLIEHRKEMYCLDKYIDLFQCTIKSMRDYVQDKKYCRTVNLFDGIDFNYYRPADNRDFLKKELGIDPASKVILYVGRFYRDKDTDFLINAYKKIKQLRDDTVMLMVGGYKSDEFYRMGVDGGVRMVERVPPAELLKYHQIADVYILPTRNYIVKNFGGIGTALIQSLACNVPVISDNLMHFQGGNNEIDKVGRLLVSEEKLIENIFYILDHKSEFSGCRELARKYYDVDVCTYELIDIYRGLFRQYHAGN